MKRIYVLVCLAIIATTETFSSEISSKIDFESEESKSSEEETHVENNAGKLKAESPIEFRNRHSPLRPHGNVGIVGNNGLKKRRTDFPRNDERSKTMVINNIKIVVNGNETQPGLDPCKEGICNVSVSSRPDDEGNIVTDVHLSIVTNSQNEVKVDDVPVIDGNRGTESVNEDKPIFYLLNRPILPRTNLLHNNIPQIQVHNGDGERWFQGRTGFLRPHTSWYYPNYDKPQGKFPPGSRTWVPTRPVQVDDKIDSPISKTKSSHDDQE